MNIELEITLKCNAFCLCCDRFCNMEYFGIDYSDGEMSMRDIKHFAELVKAHGRIENIQVLGGEPTLHPYFREIVFFLKETLLDHGFIKSIGVSSNGLRPELLENLPPEIRVIVSPVPKERHRQSFIAPADTGQKQLTYCIIPLACGISYSKYGVFPCGAGGAIARLFEMRGYRKEILPHDAGAWDNMKNLCDLCQMKADVPIIMKEKREISSRFAEAIRKKRLSKGVTLNETF